MNLVVAVLSFLLLVLWRGGQTMQIPEKDMEAVKELITSFVVVEGDKEYRWQKDKSAEPFDEGFVQETKSSEGDILKPPAMSTQEFNKRKVVETRNLWPNGIIPWAFNQAERKFTVPKAFTLVKEAINTMEKLTCLKFPQWNRKRSFQLGSNYLDIGQGSGCASYVGFYGKGPQPVLLNQNGCMKVGIILHEICHSLGFYHEHSRTDRDKYINILFNNVRSLAYPNFEIHNDSNNYVHYDLESIMHYGLRAFSQDSGMTIKPKDENLAFLLGQRSQLSFYDIKTITEAYQCTRHCKRPHQRCRNGGYLDVTCKCRCPFGLKGVDCRSVINNNVCGGIVSLSVNKQKTSIYFTSDSIGKDKRIQCFWLIKAPLMNHMQLDLVEFHMKEARSSLCKQWLEIRYNMIGQQGPKYCGDLSGDISFVSTTNLLMLTLDSIMIPLADAEFTIELRLLEEKEGDISCTFEMENGMCIFYQVDTDDFDWILIQGPTPSKYTGPVSGNNGSKRYLYIETSFPRRPGDTAILESRYIPAGNKCITIHYNMYGRSVGQLTMKLMTEKGNILDAFQEKGSKGIEWKTYAFFIESPLPFKILIEATVGPGASGDIAIDDISIKNGTCHTSAQTARVVKRILTQIDCGFEDACNFSWQPQSIAKVITSSLSGDASLIGSLLIFTWILKDGEEATILSPVMPYYGVSCLSVSYYVIGISQGNLFLTITDPANNKVKLLWSSSDMTHNKGGNNRITEEINESFEMIQVILTVALPAKSPSVSLLAIDHIQLISSPCNQAEVRLPFACDFDQWCGFVPDKYGDWRIATKGVIFGPLTGSYFRKKPFLLYQGLLSRSPEQSSVTSPPINFLGKGCLSFNFFARGIILKGIRLTKEISDDMNTVVWDSSKMMLMAVWSRIKIPLMANGEFRLIFSTMEKDVFANYAIDNMRLNPVPCPKI